MVLKRYTIKKYDKSHYDIWNNFVAESKNGTFLFHRDFMEYHSDRFVDFSLLVFDEKGKLVCIIPANRVGDEIFSHQGLTYGGLVFTKDLGAEVVDKIFKELLYFFKELNLIAFYIKQIPAIYHRLPSNEMEYFLFQNKADLVKREMNLAINYSGPLKISKSKLKHFNRIDTAELTYVFDDDNFQEFWDGVLIPRLKQKHSVKPVHTLEEILFLKSKFPNNIKQMNAYYKNKVVAGLTLFVSQNVIKSQYGATSDIGEKLRALDFLFITTIHSNQNAYDFFDMGIVNENNGLDYNSGLLKQKEELGCSIYSQDYYKISL